MGCPYFEEVVMVFCRAYPLKKLIPRNLSTSASCCASEDFERCPFYQEVTARADAVARTVASIPEPRPKKEEDPT